VFNGRRLLEWTMKVFSRRKLLMRII